MDPLVDLTALELASALRRRELGVVEVTTLALSRAETVGAAVGAFTTLAPERALARAESAQRRIDRDEGAVLTGVPTAIKDLEPTRGVRTTLGSAVFAEWVPDVDDVVVDSMDDAGLVWIGKTTVPELGAACYTEPEGAAPARSPHDLERSAAGSSGGAAAAVAARVIPLSQGSDTAGSLRSPASACGIVGLKPSRGLLTGGLAGHDGLGLSTKGPLALSVRDAAALLDVLADAPPVGSIHPPRRTGFLAACDEEVPRLRIAVAAESVSGTAIDPLVAAAVDDAAELLAALGHIVSTVSQPTDPVFVEAFSDLFSALAAAKPVPADADARLRPIVRYLRARGRGLDGGAMAASALTVQASAGRWAERFRDADVVVQPTITRLPAHVGELRDDGDPAGELAAMTAFTGNTILANATGFPAISLPLGWTHDGIPIGVMLTARWGCDDLLLALSAQIERAAPWRHHLPRTLVSQHPHPEGIA
ncbi:amidase [Microbacterium sp. Leaf159]|uniref:amidase n=1 Tax=Microbacterium sp. Leaf159 TaxID=1736279 RepID=UPI0006F8ED08|nr:amidase [Microbacterium sp. Leaf159]KQR37378.1 amidase [Microbacterium sp. Leaf159]